ncbi:hypothetical protein DJ71_22150 [Halorubrum sp. E3]|nr:hypothetical protein DJ71_22150 [Halorubrum sp. E3]
MRLPLRARSSPSRASGRGPWPPRRCVPRPSRAPHPPRPLRASSRRPDPRMRQSSRATSRSR